MNNKTTSKKDIYIALGYVLLLAVMAFPLSLAGMKMLNFVLGHIKM